MTADLIARAQRLDRDALMGLETDPVCDCERASSCCGAARMRRYETVFCAECGEPCEMECADDCASRATVAEVANA